MYALYFEQVAFAQSAKYVIIAKNNIESVRIPSRRKDQKCVLSGHQCPPSRTPFSWILWTIS